jgi:hypothetical protein
MVQFTPKPRTYRSDKMKFEGLIQDGENENGFTAQTPNGTAKWAGTGWNQRAYTYEAEQIPEVPTASGPRTNRTGE